MLRARAAAAHQSLQEYLLRRLVDEASRPTLDEVLDRAAKRGGGVRLTGDEIAQLVRVDRDGR